MRSRLAVVLSAVVLAISLAACGGSSGGAASSGASTTTTEPPPIATCDEATNVATTTTEANDASTSSSDSAEPPDAELPQDEIPEGSWTGPIVVSATGTPTNATGTVFNPGGGSIHLEIKSHHVKSGTATFTVSSSGTVTTGSGTGTISGTGTMSDGTVSGTSKEIAVAGTLVQNGSILITVKGVQVTAPLNQSVPFTAKLTITSVSCAHVVATFIPDLNDQAGGGAVFSGTAEWRGDRD